MLIDASHPEETRVVVITDQKLEEFDFETSTKKQIKSNIYLARVVRVEPSLQAAFVEFGGNRHGFLAFNEIHPNYYRIPVEDQKKLLEEAASEAPGPLEESGAPSEEENIDEDADFGEQASRRLLRQHTRTYKIQEVIKRRQVMLVQVVKDERGGKGAALTTFISLAGRYCVLMPNTPRGGGISRKISNPKDRTRLRDIMESLSIPEDMGLIVRTAGMGRTKTEIKRDADYLLRLWDEIREQTLSSTAPQLIYAEGDLISRSIRDLYSKDIENIYVEGEEGYKKAKAFMRMLIPSHSKRIQLYKDPQLPLFHRYNVEEKLDNIHSAIVQLPSGGYLVINQTEALVSIDVNSGRATKERHIEETALKTNLEAAEEVGRQLRLRDLAGLIVIDFIDMEVAKNNALVERRFREALRDDRARIQMGSISMFGLLEMSRQRLRPSLVEASTAPCTYCRGTGVVRSIESSALRLLRALEKEGIEGRFAELTAYVPSAIAFYILNQKRSALTSLETRYQFHVFIAGDDALFPPDFRIAYGQEKKLDGPKVVETARESSDQSSAEPTPTLQDPDDKEEPTKELPKKRSRRRRNRGKRQGGETTSFASAPVPAAEEKSSLSETEIPLPASSDEETDLVAEPRGNVPSKRHHHLRHRGRRSGRIRSPQSQNDRQEEKGSTEEAPASSVEVSSSSLPVVAPAPAKKHRAPVIKTIGSAVEEFVPPPVTQPKKGWWKKLLE